MFIDVPIDRAISFFSKERKKVLQGVYMVHELVHKLKYLYLDINKMLHITYLQVNFCSTSHFLAHSKALSVA